MIIATDVAPITGCDVLACRPRRSDLHCGREMAPRNFCRWHLPRKPTRRDCWWKSCPTRACGLRPNISCVLSKSALAAAPWELQRCCTTLFAFRNTRRVQDQEQSSSCCIVHEYARQSRSPCAVGRFQTSNLHLNMFRSFANVRADNPSGVKEAPRHHVRVNTSNRALASGTNKRDKPTVTCSMAPVGRVPSDVWRSV